MWVVHLVLCSLLVCSSTFPREASDGAPSVVCYTAHTFWVALKWMAAGEKGQRCCYCSTKACGHIKSLSSGRARGKLANILRLSQRCPMKSDWLHTSRSVCVFHHLCVPERGGREGDSFSRRQWNHTRELWYNWESGCEKDARLRELAEAVWSQELSQRAGRQQGAFLPRRRGGHLLWMDENSRTGGNGNLFVV